MDKKNEKKKLSNLTVVITGLLILSGFTVLYNLFLKGPESSLNINKNRLVTEQVKEGVFREFVDLNGTVQPVRTTYLDAVEGGVVRQVFAEPGSVVEEGDTIVVLTNSALQLNVLQQEAGIYDQINNVRNSRLNLEQNHLNLQKELADSETRLELAQSAFKRDKTLYEQELLSLREFEESKLEFGYQKNRYELNYESFRRDSVQLGQQLNQLNESEKRMWRSLDGVQQILENLVVRAPISGQLSTMELDPGLSINQGERLGRIDRLDRFKIRAGVDEFYLSRVQPGLSGTFEYAGRQYDVVADNVFPVIQDGRFQVDFELLGDLPDALRRGQTIRIRLELGNSGRGLLLSRGAFFQQTGGNWVFLLDEENNRAIKQPVRLGRSNNDYFEVIDGLTEGQTVITSSYSSFEDYDLLILDE